jgi:hypothetical protein
MAPMHRWLAIFTNRTARDRLFARIVDAYPPAEHYVGFTDRPLPVLALYGSSAAAAASAGV